MKITILGSGTSTGVPEIGCSCEVCTSSDSRDNRLRASILIETAQERILIDCGPDFRYQMLRAGITQLTGLLITHIHYDHVGGVDDLRPFCRDGAFKVYAERRVSDVLHKKYDYIFCENPYPGVPKIDLITIHRTPFRIGDTEIIPVRIMHGKLPILGYRIGNMAYLTDITQLPDGEDVKLQNLELLIVDALRWKEHPSHFSVDQALELSARLKPKRTVFTHMSHHIGLHSMAQNLLPEGVSLAYDGLVIQI